MKYFKYIFWNIRLSFLDDLFEAAIGPVAGLLGVHSSNSAARDAARESRAAQKEMYQNRYQWSRKDMEAAGYNPILMASQGPGSMPTTATAQTFDSSAGMERGASALAKGAAKLLTKEQINTEKRRQEQLTEQSNLAYQQKLGTAADNELKMNTIRQMNSPDAWGAMLRHSAAARDAGLINAGSATAAGIKQLLPAASQGFRRTWPFLRTLPQAIKRKHYK